MSFTLQTPKTSSKPTLINQDDLDDKAEIGKLYLDREDNLFIATADNGWSRGIALVKVDREALHVVDLDEGVDWPLRPATDGYVVTIKS